MNNYLWYLLDHMGLFLLHREKSKEYQFNQPLLPPKRVDVKSLSSFYVSPYVPNIAMEKSGQSNHYVTGKMHYESQVHSVHSENNVSSGLFYENDSQSSNTNVIFVHGWRMNDLDKIKNIFLPYFMKRGLNMYFSTLPYHLDRTPGHALYGGEFMISADVDRTLSSVQQAVSDIRALIYWLKKNRPGKVILIGISLGGLFSNLVSVVEEQLDGLVSIFYANNLAYSVWETIPGKFIKRDLIYHSFTYEQLKSHWAMITPSHFKPFISTDKILLVSAIHDQYVKKYDADLLWESWGRPKRLLYECGHAGIVFQKKKIAHDVTGFLQQMELLNG